MSSISKAGIFIDVKQLLDFTYRVTGAFEVDLYANLRMLKDKLDSGSYLPLHNYSFMHRRTRKNIIKDYHNYKIN